MPSAFPPIPPFPEFRRIKVVMPIQGEDLTLWPEKRESWWEIWLGSPFELRFFAKDFLKISCDGMRVEIQPHYSESTFDTFWIDTSGVVSAQALGGLFPFTLGKQRKLLEGLVVTLGAIPHHVKKKDEAAKPLIRAIHSHLRTLQQPPTPAGEPPQAAGPLAALGNRLWEHKLRNWRPEP